MMDSSIVFLLIAILLVGIFIFVAIALTGRRTHEFDKEAYQIAFLQIENTLRKENQLTYHTAIIEADKLLDRAMNEMGVPGKTMGERLKHVGNKFTKLNSVWYAHKIRNQIAHEHGFKPEYNQAKHALAAYKQALKDLGAI
ncbi:hypothetical protein IJH97_02505 [Candidatus Saccharibacteria bacterium]|nr:hypothetical protein [Candidatus Saccharibacteria bacterium]